MPQILPLVPSLPSYRFGTVLDGTPYVIDMHWNARGSAWYMDLYDEDLDPIRLGIRVVLGTFLGRRTADPRYPRGTLVASDLSGEGRDATLDDLGSRVMVYHYTPEEAAAA